MCSTSSSVASDRNPADRSRRLPADHAARRELAAGETSPDDETLHVTTTKAGLSWVYVVETIGGDIDDSIAALPPDLQAAFAELRAALEVPPWTVGTPSSRPTPPVCAGHHRRKQHGMVVYHVLERDPVGAILQVSFVEPRR